jgi:hypothetical protein
LDPIGIKHLKNYGSQYWSILKMVAICSSEVLSTYNSHCVSTQKKNIVIFDAVRTSDLICWVEFIKIKYKFILL